MSRYLLRSLTTYLQAQKRLQLVFHRLIQVAKLPLRWWKGQLGQKDCLQLFCVISNMVVIKSIIDANEMMDKTIAEIKQLQRETN